MSDGTETVMDGGLQLIEGGAVTSVPGFRAAGVACGIKKSGALDLALIASERPCVGAAVFTTNKIQSPAVTFDRALLAERPDQIHAIVVNSGCANAVTGQQGFADAREMSRLGAQAIGNPDAGVVVMSTGVIGQHLPMERIAAGITMASERLADQPDAGHAAARAIMTTDTRPKEVAARAEIGGAVVTFGGMCKGSGMIHPDMATMLAMIVTDAAIAAAPLQAAVRYAADRSFNAVTVDGDASTNDTFLVLAHGGAANQRIESTDRPEYLQFRAALTAVAVRLAREIARDGEGATKFVTITVRGAMRFAEARQGARVIATSSLVKTAIYGADANWGRVLAAIGRSGIDLDPGRIGLWFDDLQLVADGTPLPYAEADAHATLTKPEVTITVDLGLGHETATVWTCDLSHDYVSINADYRT
jgi:glutamate N-acetyltransferase / amino-acid N-acetyltransferase